MRKLCLLLCLFALCSVNAQISHPVAEVKNPQAVQKQKKSGSDWTVQFKTTVTPKMTSPIGITAVDTFLVTGSVTKPTLYKIGFDSKVIDSNKVYGLPSSEVTGSYFVGFAYDGQYLYVSNGNNAIYRLNSSMDTLAETITLPADVKAAALAYAPDADGGKGGFYVALVNYGIKLFSRSGVLLKSISNEDLGYDAMVWGLAYDNYSEGGPYLYVLERYPQNIIRIDVAEGRINAPVHNVSDDASEWANYYSYGIYIKQGVYSKESTTLGIFYMAGYHIGYDFSTVNDLVDNGFMNIGSDMAKYHKVNTPKTVSAKFVNTGKNALDSCKFNYEADGQIYTHKVKCHAINFVEGFTLVHSEPFTPSVTDTTYTMKLWLSEINGTNLSSDTLEFSFQTYSNAFQRSVLHEAFSSATCSPCKVGNANLKRIFKENPENWTCIKYQVSWPGNGDPYYTSEVNSRRNYYGVNSVPYMRADGDVFVGNSASYTAEILNEEAEKPSFVGMTGNLTYDGGKKFSAEINVDPLKSIDGNTRLFAALVEAKTVKNIANEYLNYYGPETFYAHYDTVFYFVCKKFLTPVTGTPIALEEGQAQKFNFEYEFNGSYRLPEDSRDCINLRTEHSVENFDNIFVVYWIQDYTTTEVFQSGKSGKASGVAQSDSKSAEVVVYPNPASGMLNINSDVSFTSVKLMNISGQTVYKAAVCGKEYSLDIQDFAAGLYILQLNTKNGVVNKKVSIR